MGPRCVAGAQRVLFDDGAVVSAHRPDCALNGALCARPAVHESCPVRENVRPKIMSRHQRRAIFDSGVGIACRLPLPAPHRPPHVRRCFDNRATRNASRPKP